MKTFCIFANNCIGYEVNAHFMPDIMPFLLISEDRKDLHTQSENPQTNNPTAEE